GHLPCRENSQWVAFPQMVERAFETHDTALGILVVLKRVHGHDIGLQRLYPVQQKIGDNLEIRTFVQQKFEEQYPIYPAQRMVADGNVGAGFWKSFDVLFRD